MRAKEQRLVVTFHTTTEAMAAEKELKLNQIAGRLIPVPRQISAGCGLAWSAPAAGEEAEPAPSLEELMAELDGRELVNRI